MLSCRLVLLLVLLVFAASGCRTDISGVMSINEVAAFCDDPSITWFPVEETMEKYWGEVSELRAKADAVRAARSGPPKLSALEIRLRSEYVGLTVEEARSLAQRQGRIFRLGDGAITADFRTGRITARTKDGIVQSISLEGDR